MNGAVEMKVPDRYVVPPTVRARFGEKVDRLGPRFFDGDPLADRAVESLSSLSHGARNALVEGVLKTGAERATDAPEALRAFVAACERVPFWVDFERAARGGAAFLRSGLLGGLVLGTYSLTISYCSPAGNKPLVLSGRLEQDTPRRLAETSRYVQLVSQADSMRPGRDGWSATVKVRLMHAMVRRMASASPRWNTAAWGTPINQPDMAGTGLLFSWIVLDGLDKLGFSIEGQEREDLLHLWRYVSWLQGVDEDLLWSNEREARDFWELLGLTQGPPDEDSRALVHALLASGRVAARSDEERRRAERMLPVSHALSRYFLGDELADAVQLPRTRFERALPALRPLRAATRMLARAVPSLPVGTPEIGARYWQFVVEQGLRGTPADFAMPDRLRDR
ncbi:MAG: oxygenase MpaB family protein [Polyangiales bacterium]